MFFMAASCLVVAESVFVGYLYNHDEDTPPPVWLHHLVVKYMAVIAGMKEKKSKRQESIHIEVSEENEEELPQINGEILNWVKQTNKSISSIKKDLYMGRMIKADFVTQWRNIAQIIDRFCFRLCFIIIIVLTVLILVLLPLFLISKRN